MSVTKATFSLSELITNVTSPVSIKEILEVYEQTIIAEDQFSFSVIIPILKIRMKEITQNYLMLEPQIKATKERVKDLLEKSEQVLNLLGVIRSEYDAIDKDSKIQKFSENVTIDFEKSFKVLELIFLEVVDHEIKIRDLNPVFYSDSLEIINDMVMKDQDTTDWISEHLDKLLTNLSTGAK